MKHGRVNRALLIFSLIVTAISFPAAIFLWFRSGDKAISVTLFLLGLSLGLCMTAYACVPISRKQPARRVVLVTGGLSIMAFSVLSRANLDLEGFFMLLMMGTMGAAVGHTLVTVIVGPVFFGRFLCGWGCWRGMILELLPVRKNPGRRKGWLEQLPFLGLALSIAAAIVSVFLLGHHPGGAPGSMHAGSLRAILIAYGVYYLAAIGLAFAFNDQRAFCKYLCPSGMVLGLTSRLSLLKMSSDARLCNSCGACSKVCPMDIDVTHFAVLGQRVRSGQCILCQQCAHACPTNALRLTAALDTAARTPFLRHPKVR